MSEQTTDRLYPVHIDGKSGFIDAQGSVVVAARFDMAGPFHDGLAQVGDLDLDGTPVVPGVVKRMELRRHDGPNRDFTDHLWPYAAIHGRLGEDSGARRGRGWLHQPARRVRLAVAEVSEHLEQDVKRLLAALLDDPPDGVTMTIGGDRWKRQSLWRVRRVISADSS